MPRRFSWRRIASSPAFASPPDPVPARPRSVAEIPPGVRRSLANHLDPGLAREERSSRGSRAIAQTAGRPGGRRVRIPRTIHAIVGGETGRAGIGSSHSGSPTRIRGAVPSPARERPRVPDPRRPSRPVPRGLRVPVRVPAPGCGGAGRSRRDRGKSVRRRARSRGPPPRTQGRPRPRSTAVGPCGGSSRRLSRPPIATRNSARPG